MTNKNTALAEGVYGRRNAGLLLCLIASTTLIAACDVKYPTGPSAQASVTGLEIQFASLSGPLRLNQEFHVVVYALDSDGVYQPVNAEATLTSSDTRIVQVASLNPSSYKPESRSLRAVGAGRAEITATYQGRSASLPALVSAVTLPPYPYLLLSANSSRRLTLGSTFQVAARYMESGTSQPFVTSDTATTWTSSDPGIASVQAGLVTGLRVGTVEITVTYGGISESFRISVAPR